MAKKRALIVLSDAAKIQIVSDPVRKEMLRLLSTMPLTQTDLSKLLGITTTSVGYHLKLLLDAGMIRLQRISVEEHGIVQKFYEPVAAHFVVDYDKAPLVARKRSLDVHMERLRGIMSLFQIVEWKRNRQILITSDAMEELVEEMARSMATLAKNRESDVTELDRETYLTSLYGEVLLHLLQHEKWQVLLEGSSSLWALIKKLLQNNSAIQIKATPQLAVAEN